MMLCHPFILRLDHFLPTLIGALIVAGSASLSTAAPPRFAVTQQISAVEGVPQNGQQFVVFSLFQGGTATDADSGLLVYSEAATLDITNNTIEHIVGTGSPVFGDALTADKLAGMTNMYLQINVGDARRAVMPRLRIDSVPYALQAGNAETLGGRAAADYMLQEDHNTQVSKNAVGAPGTGVGSTIGGGSFNTASGDYSTAGGGYGNSATGRVSTIAGGEGNRATSNYGTIAGGYYNIASYFSSVGGGNQNKAYNYSTIAGGYVNTADGLSSFVGGGAQNLARGERATVAGGWGNETTATNASIVGGRQNRGWGISSFVGGGDNNRAMNHYSTVGGGVINASLGLMSTVGGGEANTAIGQDSTIGGGRGSTAGGFATVGGGDQNSADGYASTIGGGSVNEARGEHSAIGGGNGCVAGDFSAIGGGNVNYATGFAATVAGGEQNNAEGERGAIAGGSNNAAGNWAAVGGGLDNIAAGDYSTVAGGRLNRAAADYTFAAGRRAKALHGGSFIWADSIDADFSTDAGNAFNVRAANGARFYSTVNSAVLGRTTGAANNGVMGESTGSNGRGVYGECNNGSTAKGVMGKSTSGFAGYFEGNVQVTGNLFVNGAINPTSDRAVKTAFSGIDCREILHRLLEVRIEKWKYREDKQEAVHIGPMAQDFAGAFEVGTDDKHIATVDADGVALAAIQGLHAELVIRDKLIAEQKETSKKQQQMLETQERLIEKMQERLDRLETAGVTNH